MNQAQFAYNRYLSVVILCKMTHMGKIPWKKIRILKGETGKGVCGIVNLVNTDFSWRLNLNINSSRMSSLNSPGSQSYQPAHISTLLYPMMKELVCAISPTTGWAPSALHQTRSLVRAGARRVLWAATQKCVWACSCAYSGPFVVAWRVTQLCSITSFTPVFSNVNNKYFVQKITCSPPPIGSENEGK